MSTFGITNSDPQTLMAGLNYVLSNLNTQTTGNTDIGNALVGNTTTGTVTTNGQIYGWLYPTLYVAYADDGNGTNFSFSPTNRGWFGQYDPVPNITPQPTNPSNYIWTQITGGFGTTKFLFYSTTGGGQIQWQADTTSPGDVWRQVQDSVPINLTVVTSSNIYGNQIVANSVTSSQISTDYVYGGNLTANQITSGTITGNVIYGGNITGDQISGGTISGNVIYAGTVTANSVSASGILAGSLNANVIYTSTITAAQITAGSLTSNVVYTGSLYGNQIVANTITSTQISSSYIYAGNVTANQISSGTLNSNVIYGGNIYGNQIVANTITSNQISSSYIYAGNIVSIGAQSGNISSNGYWLDYSSGNARFGGNINIGNDLVVGANAYFGNNITIQGLITQGNIANGVVNTYNLVDLSVTNSVESDANPDVTLVTFDTSTLWPAGTRGNAIPNGIAIQPTTTSATQGSKIIVNYQTYISSATNSEYNLVELWKKTVTYSSLYTFNDVKQLNYTVGNSVSNVVLPTNANVYYNSQMVVGGSGGSFLYTNDYGNSWTFLGNTSIYSGNVTAVYGGQNFGSLKVNLGNVIPNTAYLISTTTSFNSFGVSNDNKSSVYGVGYYSTYASDNYSWPNPPQVNKSANAVIVNSYTNNANAGGTYQQIINSRSGNNIIYSTVSLGITGGLGVNTPAYEPSVAVGQRGTIYNIGQLVGAGGTNETWANAVITETSNTTVDLYAVDSATSPSGNLQVSPYSHSLIAVGAQGTILTNTRTISPNTSSGWVSRVSGTAVNLYGVGAKYVTTSGAYTTWFIVGALGTVLKTTNNGSTFTQISTPVTATLRDVINFGNTSWLACGDGGTIIVTYDNGVTWSSITNPAGDGSLQWLRNLRKISLVSPTALTSRIVIVGDGIIMYADTTNLSTWTVAYNAGYSVNSDLQRVQYYGSYANVSTTTQPSTTQRLGNNQVITGTYSDKNFVEGTPVYYYLIAGNMANTATYVQGSAITATEYKR